MTSPIEKILSRIDSPQKGTRDGQYFTFCPHQTKRDSEFGTLRLLGTPLMM